MKSFAELDIENNGDYLRLLSAVSKLSGMFSDSAIPYISYRVIENLFCRCFRADNLSRSDTAYDANLNAKGIGIKTFICNTGVSNEKIAEFNSLSRELKNYKGNDLAYKLAEYRNDRIDLANRLYNIDDSIYHIIARKKGELILFETDYQKINVNKIKSVKPNNPSLSFEDGINSYSFNYSKNTLFRRFQIPQNAFNLPVEILNDPYKLLLDLTEDRALNFATDKLVRGVNYVILPLYGYKKYKEKFVFERSGLNQWNARGRERKFGELYILIPAEIRKKFPNFFPSIDKSFELKIPSGEVFSAKVCQEEGKALMTNPNDALANWILRKVFQVKEGELLTIERMNELGSDSVIIIKDDDGKYKIDIMKTDSYEQFISIRS